MRSPRLIVLALVTCLALAACQSTPPASPAATTAAAAPTPAVTASPSPTAAPPDVLALFTARAAKLANASYAFTGTTTAGLVQASISGTATIDGLDSVGSTSTTVAGVETTTNTTQVAGDRYTQATGLPMLEAPGTASASNLGSELRHAASTVSADAGVETRDGRQLHRLAAAASNPFDPSVIISGAAGATNVKADVEFFAGDDGSPVAASISATWSQTAGGKAVDASMSVDVQISQLGIQLPITVPAHVWTVFTSSRWHYSLAYPDDYTYSTQKTFDLFNGPDFANAYAQRVSAAGFPLNDIAQSELSYLEKLLGAKSGTNVAITVGGAKGRLLTVSGINKAIKAKVVDYEVVVVKGGNVYFVGWYFKPGTEATDLATFKEMVATFKFT